MGWPVLEFRTLVIAAMLLCGIGCTSPALDESTPSKPPFFEDMGGMAGITATVDAFLMRLAQDERIVHRFAMIDVARFRQLLIEQFCMLAGGPCEYSGASMLAAHRTQGIRDDEFDALVGNLMDAMEDVGIPLRVRNQLLGRLAPMYSDIVER